MRPKLAIWSSFSFTCFFITFCIHLTFFAIAMPIIAGIDHYISLHLVQ